MSGYVINPNALNASGGADLSVSRSAETLSGVSASWTIRKGRTYEFVIWESLYTGYDDFYRPLGTRSAFASADFQGWIDILSVPEPDTIALVGLGFAGLGLGLGRRRKAKGAFAANGTTTPSTRRGFCFCGFAAQMRRTPATTRGTLIAGPDLERLARDYWQAVQRIRRMSVSLASKMIVLADVEVIYWRERAGKLGPLLAQLPTKTGTDSLKPATGLAYRKQ